MSEKETTKMNNKIRPYIVQNVSGINKVFEVSHKGLESAIEYAREIGAAVVREDRNGNDEIIAFFSAPIVSAN